jgi:hypothetical protein
VRWNVKNEVAQKHEVEGRNLARKSLMVREATRRTIWKQENIDVRTSGNHEVMKSCAGEPFTRMKKTRCEDWKKSFPRILAEGEM